MKPIIASGSVIVTVYRTVMSTPNGRTDSLQIYVLFMFTQRARACVRAGRARMCAFAYFILVRVCPNLLGTYYDSP
jgi:hypothetical protein